MDTRPIMAPAAHDDLPRIEWQSRTIPIAHLKHITGQFPVHVQSYSVPFESRLERDVMAWLCEVAQPRFVQAQPFTVHYSREGRHRRYTPDLLVVVHPVPTILKALGFRSWTVIEVKPFEKFDQNQERIAFRLALIHRVTGWAAVCVTERALVRSGGKQ